MVRPRQLKPKPAPKLARSDPAAWRFACPDWADRLREGRSLIPDGLPLDPAEAERAVAIFNKLRLPDVPGQPTLGEAGGEWQRDLARVVFGSLVDGVRMVPELFVMVPKKMSKTTGGAAIALTGLLMNMRPRAEFIYVGPTQEVADVAFSQTAGMIEADEFLTKRFSVSSHTKTIFDRRTKARLKVKTFDPKVVTGSKPAFVLLDELHAMASISGADRIIGQIRGGHLANREAVLIVITTQSDTPPSGVYKTELDYARGVRDGKIPDGRVLPIIYEFPADVQRSGAWRNSALWPWVMPNLNRPITIDQLERAYAAAREKGPAEEKRWASQHLNVEIGVAIGGWPGSEYWEAAGNEALTLDSIIADSDVVIVGLDGGGLDDLLGLAFVGRHATTREWMTICYAWAHRGVLERRKAIAGRLGTFEQAGDMEIYDTPGEDLAGVVELVGRVKAAGKLGKVVVDPAGLGEIADALAGIEVTMENGLLMSARQGIALMSAIKTLERKLANGTLRHAAQPLMAWCVGNLKIEETATAIRATKANAGDAKVDPLMALFDAIAVMSLNPDAQGSVYETRELTILDLTEAAAVADIERTDLDALRHVAAADFETWDSLAAGMGATADTLRGRLAPRYVVELPDGSIRLTRAGRVALVSALEPA